MLAVNDGKIRKSSLRKVKSMRNLNEPIEHSPNRDRTMIPEMQHFEYLAEPSNTPKRSLSPADGYQDQADLMQKLEALKMENEKLRAQMEELRMENKGLRSKVRDRKSRKLFEDTIAASEKDVAELDAEARDFWYTTTSEYAEAAVKHIPAAEELKERDPELAFNLLLYLAVDASYGDMSIHPSMCGESGISSEATFEALDSTLLPLIESRKRPISRRVELVRLPRRHAGRRKQREETRDWISLALVELIQSRDYLEKHGIEGFLPRCIAKLEELDDARV